MSSPWSDPPVKPGSQDQDQPCRAYAAPCGETPEPVEHEMSYLMRFGDPHPVGLICSCGRKYQVTGP